MALAVLPAEALAVAAAIAVPPIVQVVAEVALRVEAVPADDKLYKG